MIVSSPPVGGLRGPHRMASCPFDGLIGTPRSYIHKAKIVFYFLIRQWAVRRKHMVKFPAASASAEAAQRRRCCGKKSPELPRALKLLSGGAALGFDTIY